MTVLQAHPCRVGAGTLGRSAMGSVESGSGGQSDWGSRQHVHTLLLMAVTVAGLYLCFEIVAPFVPAMAGALGLAVLFAPLHRWLERRLGAGNLATAISVLVVALIVVVPVLVVANRLINELGRGAGSLQAMVESGSWRAAFDKHALLAPVGHWLDRQVDLVAVVAPVASWLTSTGTSLVKGSMVQAISVVLVFYMLFYMLRDRAAAMQSLRSLSPLSPHDMSRLFSNVTDTVHATVYGTLVVSVIQGALGGLMFWWLGLPEPLVWGVVMGLLAVVPVLGAFVIWVPAAIFLALDGQVGSALLLAAWGAIVVGGIDNLLYPMLVGNRLRMHTLVAFVSIVGGLIIFGPAGLILGPVVFTVTRLLLQVWRRPTPEAPTSALGPAPEPD
ncbi:MAG: AI-2E family transporter [Arenimonas sp.]|uniref:AI-2E family transporter n=1 Tax=Arenimonas sp. TaxID=1872635 RepID=UPI0025BF5AE0|nr:AI-2E family transporter [Arenimonas sp.]MBW8367067.1 AI-2E family transporter [Arenimonas sp.]